jgi:hypothetical protein
MTVRSIGLGFLAGLALASAGCAKHGPLAGSAHDASSEKDAGAGDARPNASDGNRMGPDSTRSGPDGHPDVDDHWTLPHSGGPIWRNSTVPYCGSEDGWIGHIGDLWSDSRGVYVIRTVDTNYGLYFNSGSGWSRVSPQPRTKFNFLVGIPAGPLLLFGDSNGDTTCGLTAFDGKTESCLAAVSEVSNVFAVDAQRVFAISDDRLLALSGSYLTQYGIIPTSPWPSYQLWADSQVVVVADHAGNVFLFDDPSADPQVLAAPDGMAVMSLWGFGRGDLWVGDDAGRLAHYDGESWTMLQVAQGNCLGVSQMWGAEHILYFATESYVGRWSDGKVDTVLDGPCEVDPEDEFGTYEKVLIERIWGNSPTELFIAVQERKETKTLVGSNGATYSSVGPDACGQFRVYWFDGQGLGRL